MTLRPPSAQVLPWAWVCTANIAWHDGTTGGRYHLPCWPMTTGNLRVLTMTQLEVSLPASAIVSTSRLTRRHTLQAA